MKLDPPVGNYMFKVNNRNIRTKSEIRSKLTIKIPERHHCSSVSINNIEKVDIGCSEEEATCSLQSEKNKKIETFLKLLRSVS